MLSSLLRPFPLSKYVVFIYVKTLVLGGRRCSLTGLLFFSVIANSLSPLQIVTSRETLQAKIQEALIYWEKVCSLVSA